MFSEKRRLVEIAAERISPNPSQPRKDFSQQELEQLADSIRQNGLLQPVLLRRDSGGYVLIAGERRWRACKMAGLRTIPAIIQDVSPRDSAMLALVENIQRSDLNFFEEAVAIYSVISDRGITQAEAAKKLGMSQSALANKLRLLKLSGEEQRMITECGLTERHARALLMLEDTEQRMRALKKIIDNGLNVTQTEEYIKRIIGAQEQKKPKRTFIAKDIRLFLNTIDHAVETMKSAGVRAVTQKRETDEYYECIVRIPKSN